MLVVSYSPNLLDKYSLGYEQCSAYNLQHMPELYLLSVFRCGPMAIASLCSNMVKASLQARQNTGVMAEGQPRKSLSLTTMQEHALPSRSGHTACICPRFRHTQQQAASQLGLAQAYWRKTGLLQSRSVSEIWDSMKLIMFKPVQHNFRLWRELP